MLPIGGLKEKILAAHRGEIVKVLIPFENKKDLEEIPARILKQVEIVPVEHMDAVLKEALIVPEDEELFAPEEECAPFRIEACVAPEKEPAQSELTAH